jgi:hypothetical protein
MKLKNSIIIVASLCSSFFFLWLGIYCADKWAPYPAMPWFLELTTSGIMIGLGGVIISHFFIFYLMVYHDVHFLHRF